MNQTKLFVLFAAALLISPLHARHSESGFLKKMFWVGFYGAETYAGCHFFTLFHNRAPQSLWPWDVAGKIWNDPRHNGSTALASVMLLRHGLRGLNRELHITDQFKR